MVSRSNLSVLHIGPAKYRPYDRGHVTYGIWRELALGFGNYHVIARSMDGPAVWSDGALRVTLITSRADREAEFLLTQFRAVPLAVHARPDVIVCQSPVLGGLAAILIARLTGARTLFELHGMEVFVPVRFGSRLWLLQQLSRFALKRADLIRVLSPRMGEELARIYGANLESRTRILPPRVDVSKFTQKIRSRGPDDALRLAMVGTVTENKGQLRLIRALSSIYFPVELHIVGEGPDLAAVRRAADALTDGASNLRVVLHGPLPHAAVADVLHNCDVFVFYSAMEAAGRAMMEAMAVGLPVIVTNAGFCVEFVDDGCEGFVLGDDPDSEVVPALEKLDRDPELAQRMGEAGRRRAERDYDAVALFQRYKALIAETAAA